MIEKNLLIGELDDLFISLRKESKVIEQQNVDQQKILENLEEELQATKDEREFLKNQSAERQQTIEKLNLELDEANGAIQKLEEARVVLNKLLGPKGVLTERERQKFLKNSGA